MEQANLTAILGFHPLASHTWSQGPPSSVCGPERRLSCFVPHDPGQTHSHSSPPLPFLSPSRFLLFLSLHLSPPTLPPLSLPCVQVPGAIPSEITKAATENRSLGNIGFGLCLIVGVCSYMQYLPACMRSGSGGLYVNLLPSITGSLGMGWFVDTFVRGFLIFLWLTSITRAVSQFQNASYTHVVWLPICLVFVLTTLFSPVLYSSVLGHSATVMAIVGLAEPMLFDRFGNRSLFGFPRLVFHSHTRRERFERVSAMWEQYEVEMAKYREALANYVPMPKHVMIARQVAVQQGKDVDPIDWNLDIYRTPVQPPMPPHEFGLGARYSAPSKHGGG